MERFGEVFSLVGREGHARLLFYLVTVSLMLAEYLYGRLHDDARHDGRETAASFVILLGNKGINLLMAGLTTVPYFWVYSHRLVEIRHDTAGAWIALFLGLEFFYYWHHVAMHRSRWFWATHSVHHSATRLNLSSGVRLGWTGQLTGHFVFYLPLVWVGFHPLAVFTMLSLNLGYQFILHLARAPGWGPLEWVLNTPRHHQVHHASNDECLDKNFGGVLIVFDRLFGTFAEAPVHEPLRYGLKGVSYSPHNPLQVLTHEWIHLGRELKKAVGFRGRFKALFGQP